MEHDIEEVAALMHIHKAASEHGGSMSNIAAMSYNRLKEINAKWGEQIAKEAEAKKEKDSAALAKAEAERQAEVDKAAEENLKAEQDEPAARARAKAQTQVPPVDPAGAADIEPNGDRPTGMARRRIPATEPVEEHVDGE
jgi:hypothetical protein